MIGGIFETIGKTLGIGQEKYFLELDDAADEGIQAVKKTASKAATAVAEKAKETSAEVVEKAQAAAATGQEKVEAAVAGVTSEASAVADKAANNTAKVAAPKGKAGKAKKAKAKKDKASKPAAKKGAAQPAEAPAAPPAPKAPSAEDIIVQAIAADSRKTDSQGNAVDSPSNFATDYLLAPTNGSRRRPGPSLNPFKGMAKDVNPRLK